MEVSALRYPGGIGLHGRSPLLRLQSDERLISLVRRGNQTAFEVLVSRYQSRLLAFCRHLLGSREDAEDILQEALAAAFNAILADDRPINVRPWLYRIARNRCLNHLRRIQAVGVDSMDVHLSEHGTTTADKVHRLEDFRMLVGDIQDLPETQKTALVLREMDALSYEQIAEAMETTVPSVKSLLVRARVSLAEAAEARMLSCEEVRVELAETVEGLRKKASPVVRRHLRACERCSLFQTQLKETSKALSAVLPIGPLVLLKKLVFAHLGHSASAGAGSSATGAGAAGQAAAVGSTAAAGSAVAGSGAGSLISFGVGTIATKAAAGLAAAALVTAGAVEVTHGSKPHAARDAALQPTDLAPETPPTATHEHSAGPTRTEALTAPAPDASRPQHGTQHSARKPAVTNTTTSTTTTTATTAKPTAKLAVDQTKPSDARKAQKATAGRTSTHSLTTVLTQTTSTGATAAPAAYDTTSMPTSTTATDQSATSTGTSATTGTSASTGTTPTDPTAAGGPSASSDSGSSPATWPDTTSTGGASASTTPSSGGVSPVPSATAPSASTP